MARVQICIIGIVGVICKFSNRSLGFGIRLDTQVHMASNLQIQKRALLYVISIVLLVCCLNKLQGENVTFRRGGFIVQHVARRSSDSYMAATLDGLTYIRG